MSQTMEKMLQEARKRGKNRDAIFDNADVIVQFLFMKKGFLHAFNCNISLRKYRNESSASRTLLALRFKNMAIQKMPFEFLKLLSSIYTKEMMSFCIEQHKDITYESLGFSNSVLAELYVHYLFNRKRIIQGDIINKDIMIKKEEEKDKQLKALVDALYNK